MSEPSPAKATSEASSATKESKQPDRRSVAEIQADIAKRRESLTQTVGQIQGQVKVAASPQNIAKKVLEKVKHAYVSESGQVNVKNVGITAGVVVSFIVIRRIARRNK